ncbi:hypothetical protein GN956_G18488 [Arapaima gigas]
MKNGHASVLTTALLDGGIVSSADITNCTYTQLKKNSGRAAADGDHPRSSGRARAASSPIMQFLRSFPKSGKRSVMAVVRSSVQKVLVFLHRLQKMAISSPRYHKLCKDMQGEMDPNTDIFRSIDGSRPKSISEETVFLKQRQQPPRGLTRNGGDLRATCDSVRLCPEASAERWSRLLVLLEELWRWLGLKDEELTQRTPVRGDALSLLLQHSHCTVSSRSRALMDRYGFGSQEPRSLSESCCLRF